MDSQFRQRLLRTKKKAQALYIKRDKAGQTTQMTQGLGIAWSKFADICLNAALIEAWKTTVIANKLYQIPDGQRYVPGLFVLGLGKLGGNDLNYSSDVDLVAFFDADLIPIPEHVGRTHVCAQVLRTMTRLLDKGTDAQFVWRVDWRLRPDPSMTDLAMSTQAGENYYFFRAAPWRRLSMIKARVVAGDRAVGQSFLKDLHPFMWRRHLEYRTLDEIAELKTRIRHDHPDLKQERAAETPLAQSDGFHLKLGLGGIREIEFYVNAQQLLFGGRVPDLQTTNTMQALKGLVVEGLIDADKAKGLSDAYWLFRALENRAQYYEDKQTHTLPTDPEIQAWLCQHSGFATWEELKHAVSQARRVVAPIFQNLLSDQSLDSASSDQNAEDALTPTQKTEIDPAAQVILDSWVNEPFKAYGLTNDQSTMLKGVGHEIATLVLATEQPEKSIEGVHQFLRDLGQPAAYLRLFRDQPRALAQVVLPLIQSPAMAILLKQSPHVVDGLLANAGAVLDAPDLDLGQEMLDAAVRIEGKYEAARAWVNEQLYMCFLSVFEGQHGFRQAEHFLTTLAEGALALVGRLVTEESGEGAADLPFAVLGMGKLGMGAMAPRSDLDLIFVVADDADYQHAQKLASRYINALNAKMREGQVYEIDMRLRPSGRSGPVVVTFSQFQSYHMTRAKTWEHLALSAMRPVAGPPALCEKISQVKQQVLQRIHSGSRDETQLLRDACKMLLRLRREKVQYRMDDPFEIKLRPGGLMETEYFINFISLKHGVEVSTYKADVAEKILKDLNEEFTGLVGIRRKLRDWTFAHRLWGPQWPAFQSGGFVIDELDDICQTVEGLIDKFLIQECDLQGADLDGFEEGPVS